ncbi:hypothetical protein [Bacillus cereus]|nr:hypothetical protein [Bacillus cereus]
MKRKRVFLLLFSSSSSAIFSFPDMLTVGTYTRTFIVNNKGKVITAHQ